MFAQYISTPSPPHPSPTPYWQYSIQDVVGIVNTVQMFQKDNRLGVSNMKDLIVIYQQLFVFSILI